MGYQTDFVGYLQLAPPLNEHEIELVNRISGSMFLDPSRTGPHVVGDGDAALLAYREGAPRGWSNWTACPQGCCLTYDGGDKANHMVPWLKFLMATFLAEAATAEGITGMTCDHVLSGMVVGEKDVDVELLWPG